MGDRSTQNPRLNLDKVHDILMEAHVDVKKLLVVEMYSSQLTQKELELIREANKNIEMVRAHVRTRLSSAPSSNG